MGSMSKEDEKFIKSRGGCPRHGLSHFLQVREGVFHCQVDEGADGKCLFALNKNIKQRKTECYEEGCNEKRYGSFSYCYNHQMKHTVKAKKRWQEREPARYKKANDKQNAKKKRNRYGVPRRFESALQNYIR